MNIGILGAGQLGRMLAISGYPLGHRFAFMGNSKDDPACDLGQISVQQNQTNAFKSFTDFADIITYESENTEHKLVAKMAATSKVYPNEKSLLNSQHRGREKALFTKLNIPCVAYKVVSSLAELEKAISQIGLPAALKTTTQGYDGKGQFIIHKQNQVSSAWQYIGEVEAILEEFIDFERELSLIAVRDANNQHKYYPLVENTHHRGILRLTVAPAPNIDAELQKTAQSYMQALLDNMNHIGVLTIELFCTKDGKLIINEMAPRVHNSGHWSIEAAQTSQFENHIRAICSMPLGAVKMTQNFAAMINIIGTIGDLDLVLKMPNAHLHLYAKTPRKNRKLGHITVTASTKQALQQQIEQLNDFLQNE